MPELHLSLLGTFQMSGGPAAIARDAKIVDWPSEMGGKMPVLRAGGNGWTCMTDDAGFPLATPINDPLCYDEAWEPWFEALFAGTEPIITRPGVVYGYAGTVSADNDDPFAVAPPAGKSFDLEPPHIGLLFPGGLSSDDFPSDMHIYFALAGFVILTSLKNHKSCPTAV